MLKQLVRSPLGLILGVGLVQPAVAVQEITLLNVSYDPTHELYQDFKHEHTNRIPEGKDH
jgi:ABC-type sulfate transport system substrate-binding protein